MADCGRMTFEEWLDEYLERDCVDVTAGVVAERAWNAALATVNLELKRLQRQVTELQEANTREVERRREAETKLRELPNRCPGHPYGELK
jgi:prefoldin subunit 5